MEKGFVAAHRLSGSLVLALACGLCALALQAAPPDAILGTWLTDDGASKVEVAASRAADGSGVYSGKVIRLKEPQRDGKPLRDANNGDAALRDRPILGLPILSGFKASGGGWSGGTVYSPRAGKSYPAELSIAPDGRLQLKVDAGLLSKTDYWTR
jgi:uncharacterized protein (DUF2147 family)